jgi:hypothetical protein
VATTCCSSTKARIAKVEQDTDVIGGGKDASGSSSSSSSSKDFELSLHLSRDGATNGSGGATDWKLVDSMVYGPQDTVASQFWIAQMRCLLVLCLLLLVIGVGVWLFQGSRGPAEVRMQCPAATVSARALGLCANCHSVDAWVAFPSALDDGGRAAVAISCPQTHNGTLRRTCGGLHTGADGGRITGSCRRKACPAVDVHLQGWRKAVYSMKDMHVVRFPTVPEGTGRVSLPCPSPSGHLPSSYRPGGMLSRVCKNGSSTWTEPEGSCEWLSCKRTCVTFLDTAVTSAVRNDSECDGSEQALLSEWSVGGQLRTPCCRALSLTGSCISVGAGLGVVRADCGADQQWAVTMGSSCEPPAALQLSLRGGSSGSLASSAVDVASASAAAEREQLYSAFHRQFSPKLSQATAGRWTLPTAGVIGTLAVSWRGGAAHHLMTSPGVSSNKHSQTTLVAGMHVYPRGRTVAALAHVSCRQLGHGPAVLASNCRAIRRLMADSPEEATGGGGGEAAGGGAFWTDIEMERLCSSAETNRKDLCPVLKHMEVNALLDNMPLSLASQADRDNYLENDNKGFSSPESCCLGNESNIAQCFRHALEQDVLAPYKQKRWCDQTVVVACAPRPTNGDSFSSFSSPSADYGKDGVWVVGEDAASSNPAKPAIMLDTGYIPECGGIDTAKCWGKLLHFA